MKQQRKWCFIKRAFFAPQKLMPGLKHRTDYTPQREQPMMRKLSSGPQAVAFDIAHGATQVWPFTCLLLATTPLSFDAALVRADETPALRAAQAATDERRAMLPTLRSLSTNPQLMLQPGFRTLPDQPAGPEGFVVLSQNINLGGLGAARKRVAAGEVDASTAQSAEARHSLRTEVARAWLDAWVARAAVRTTKEERSSSAELVARLQRAAANGSVTRVEVASARTFDAEVHAQVLEWEGREVDANARLATLLSLEEMPQVTEALPMLAPPPPPSSPDLSGLPQLRRLGLEAELETRRADEAAAQWASQLQLSLQFGHEWQGQWVGYAGVGFTLPVFETGQRERAGHRATRLHLLGSLSEGLRAANIEWQRLQHELEHTEHALEVIKGDQLPAATEAADLEQRRYERGEATLFEVTMLKRQALVARIAALIAETNVLEARHRAAELSRVLGEPR